MFAFVRSDDCVTCFLRYGVRDSFGRLLGVGVCNLCSLGLSFEVWCCLVSLLCLCLKFPGSLVSKITGNVRVRVA